jgi:hypothetical protein
MNGKQKPELPKVFQDALADVNLDLPEQAPQFAEGSAAWLNARMRAFGGYMATHKQETSDICQAGAKDLATLGTSLELIFPLALLGIQAIAGVLQGAYLCGYWQAKYGTTPPNK